MFKNTTISISDTGLRPGVRSVYLRNYNLGLGLGLRFVLGLGLRFVLGLGLRFGLGLGSCVNLPLSIVGVVQFQNV